MNGDDEFQRHVQSMRADACKDTNKHHGGRAGELGRKLERLVVEIDSEYYLLVRESHEEVEGA